MCQVVNHPMGVGVTFCSKICQSLFSGVDSCLASSSPSHLSQNKFFRCMDWPQEGEVTPNSSDSTTPFEEPVNAAALAYLPHSQEVPCSNHSRACMAFCPGTSASSHIQQPACYVQIIHYTWMNLGANGRNQNIQVILSPPKKKQKNFWNFSWGRCHDNTIIVQPSKSGVMRISFEGNTPGTYVSGPGAQN